MRNLLIPTVLVLTLSIAPVAAVTGENPDRQPAPELYQQVNNAQLDQCKGKVGDPADLSQVSRIIPSAQQVVGDTVNFSKDTIATMKGYNTHPPSDPSIGPSGRHIGPSGHVGPAWASGKDLTIHNR
jgi:hypothetical protein